MDFPNEDVTKLCEAVPMVIGPTVSRADKDEMLVRCLYALNEISGCAETAGCDWRIR